MTQIKGLPFVKEIKRKNDKKKNAKKWYIKLR